MCVGGGGGGCVGWGVALAGRHQLTMKKFCCCCLLFLLFCFFQGGHCAALSSVRVGRMVL